MISNFMDELQHHLSNDTDTKHVESPASQTAGSFPAVTQTHPLVMAYVGDAIFELYVRAYYIQRETKVRNLHKLVTALVKAATQASILKTLEPELTEEEQVAARRGRNAKVGHTPKNAAMIDYRHATGFECLLGYLFLTQQNERLLGILERAVEVGQNIIKSS
jgi:ribonuclease-3 family protein